MRLSNRALVTAALALALALAVVGCGQAGGDGAAKHAKAERPQPIPKLAGMPIKPARRALAQAKVKVAVTRRWDDRAPVGSVIATRPATGVRVRRGSSVTVTVSKGPAPGPHGALSATAVGPVAIGAPLTAVEDRFGPPDARRPTSEGNTQEWFWRPEFRLIVNPARKLVVGYCTTSPKFKTAPLGVVPGKWTGSAIAKVSARSSKPAVLAPDIRPPGTRRNLMISAGKPGSYPALIFNVAPDGTATEVCGGRPPRPA